MHIDKRYIIEEIKRTSQQNNGEPLGVARFFQETGIKETDWHGQYWARWGDAVREAGLQPNRFQKAFDEKLLLEQFISLMRELGRFPVRGELKMKAGPTNTFPVTTHLPV